MFAVWRVTYGVAGRGHVDGAAVSGFLLVGMFGLITFSSSVWVSGYAIEWERDEGTSGALFLSPASRVAVILGYGLGSFIWFLPSFAAILLLGIVTGARLHVSDPLALVCAALALILASLTTGFALAGLFILSRRGNLWANVCQQPINLLGGFLIPRSLLPAPLYALSQGVPAAHAVDALRAAALQAASIADIAASLALTLVTSASFFVIGLLALRRVEYVAKHYGQLDLY
jgi:ABC-2 type transport system permease protein